MSLPTQLLFPGQSYFDGENKFCNFGCRSLKAKVILKMGADSASKNKLSDVLEAENDLIEDTLQLEMKQLVSVLLNLLFSSSLTKGQNKLDRFFREY
jgi:hypothetical protein